MPFLYSASFRKLYLSDIARLTNPEMLINRIVFDLDVLAVGSQPPSSEYLERVGGGRQLSSESLERKSLQASDASQLNQELLTQKAEEKCLPRQSNSDGQHHQTPSHLDLESSKFPPTDADPGAQTSPITSSILQSYMKAEISTLESSYTEPVDPTDIPTEELKVPPANLEPDTSQLEAGERELMNAKEQAPITGEELEVNINQMLGELEWDSFSPMVGEVDSVEQSATESDPYMAVPHLEFESRFESGNLRRAIQAREFVSEGFTILVLHTIVYMYPLGSGV